MIHSEDFFLKLNPPKKKKKKKNGLTKKKNGCCKKYPVNACGVRDGLSGDMLASSWYHLVFKVFFKYTTHMIRMK